MIPIIVLAAGASKRLGRAKQLLDLGGSLLLDRVLATCRASVADRTVLVLGCRADAIQQRCAVGDAAVVVNDRYREGQTSSVQAGLAELDAGEARNSMEAFLLFPADFALVGPETIDRLIARFRQAPAPTAILLPTIQGKHGHPALFGAAHGRTILDLPPDVGANSVVANSRETVVEVGTDDPSVLFDIDTEADYQEALRRLSRRP